jgi:hypothetical protein
MNNRLTGLESCYLATESEKISRLKNFPAESGKISRLKNFPAESGKISRLKNFPAIPHSLVCLKCDSLYWGPPSDKQYHVLRKLHPSKVFSCIRFQLYYSTYVNPAPDSVCLYLKRDSVFCVRFWSQFINGIVCPCVCACVSCFPTQYFSPVGKVITTIVLLAWELIMHMQYLFTSVLCRIMCVWVDRTF